MSYISDIFNRLDIQEIREFLLHGTECTQKDPRPYQERIDSIGDKMDEMLTKRFPDIEEREAVMNMIYQYANVCLDVYMEIGLQCGFILAGQAYRRG